MYVTHSTLLHTIAHTQKLHWKQSSIELASTNSRIQSVPVSPAQRQTSRAEIDNALSYKPSQPFPSMRWAQLTTQKFLPF
jgi:hypothetical protein